MDSTQHYSFDVADWRRQVHRLYQAVREEADPPTAHALWVAGRTELFEHHPASARRDGQRLRHADYDPAWRFVVAATDAEPCELAMQTGTDGTVGFSRIGAFEVTDEIHLDAWWLGGYGGGLFVPVRDGSAGRLTYGAGRYLLDTVKGADLGREDANTRNSTEGSTEGSSEDRADNRSVENDNEDGNRSVEDGKEDGADTKSVDNGADRWVLDFNFAYNPSCVYDSRWACPLAPEGNRTSVPIEVGELLPEGY